MTNVLTGMIAKEFVETSNYPKVMDDKFNRLLAERLRVEVH